MNHLIESVHWFCGVAVMAEALNKLERTAPCAPGLGMRQRVVDCLKALAWALLATGGFVALITPVFDLQPPSLRDAAVMAGFAVLILRTRIKEG